MKDDAKILFNLKCYLESLLASGQDKIFYNDLLNDEKTIDCINAIEDLLKERKKYTILLIDKEYRKVIENAQMDTSNDSVIAHKFAVMQQQLEQKDKRIKELEEEKNACENEIQMHLNTIKEYDKKIKNDYIPKQVVIDKMKEIKSLRDRCITAEGYNIMNGEVIVLQELLEGEK